MAYAQNCPAVIRGVLQLLRSRITPFGFHFRFSVQMLHLPSLNNVVADFMPPPPPPEPSRTVALVAAADQVDFKAMAAEQNRSAETQHLLGGSSLKLAFRQAGAQRLVGNVSTEVFHPIVPAKFQKDIFLHLHSISHPERLASWCLVSSRFVWLGLTDDATS
jgi:hypothetical protein